MCGQAIHQNNHSSTRKFDKLPEFNFWVDSSAKIHQNTLKQTQTKVFFAKNSVCFRAFRFGRLLCLQTMHRVRICTHGTASTHILLTSLAWVAARIWAGHGYYQWGNDAMKPDIHDLVYKSHRTSECICVVYHHCMCIPYAVYGTVCGIMYDFGGWYMAIIMQSSTKHFGTLTGKPEKRENQEFFFLTSSWSWNNFRTLWIFL